ncbi:tetratricopeptide repeat protein [Halorubellus litoreus]|uniref:Tetratricopeptide repeat protein n=1 Tax=Halorubellus litoreus TaxID=755308 RepID=A0ABD5VHX3_9EURY
MFDRFTSIFGTGSDVPELIIGLGLEDWYKDLDENQRQKLRQHSTFFGTGGETNLLEVGRRETSQTAQEYLKGVGSTAANEGDYDFAEMVLLTALEREDGSATSTHFTYNELIDVYYKQRDSREDAIEKCVECCEKDIQIADEFVREFGEVPRIPAFKRLAIIYEKQERYEEALDVCDKALEIGTTDGTKGGFEGRKERIQRKMN